MKVYLVVIFFSLSYIIKAQKWHLNQVGLNELQLMHDSLLSNQKKEDSLLLEIKALIQDSSAEEEYEILHRIRKLRAELYPKGFNQEPVEIMEYENNTKEKPWVSISKPLETLKYKKKHQLDSNYRVYGFHVDWMGSAYENYNYSLLSDLAFFSIDALNPSKVQTANLLHQKVLDSCKKYKVKTSVVVTCFGKKSTGLFLRSLKRQSALIQSLEMLIEQNQIENICLDFEGVDKTNMELFRSFLIDMRTSLKKKNPLVEVHLCLPAIDQNAKYDLQVLSPFVDLFIIMGYQFYGSFSSFAGPIAPLESGTKWWNQNLSSCLMHYRQFGIDFSKIILALPYYGADWITKDYQHPSPVIRFKSNLSYSEIVGICKHPLNALKEEYSGSKCYFYTDQNKQSHQIWFEDSSSLELKYQWLKKQGFGGIGIWALGYDHGRVELWKLIAKHFAVLVPKIDTKTTLSKVSMNRWWYVLRYLRQPQLLLKRPRLILWFFGGVLGFSLMGAYILWRRVHYLKKWMFKGLQYSIVLFILILILIPIYILFQPPKTLSLYPFVMVPFLWLLIGFGTGGIGVYLLNRNQLKNKVKP